MNHLTNVYKHKCEQLQEQLNYLTKMLNEENIIARMAREAAELAARLAREAAERAAREAAERLAREAAELATRERIAEMFRRLPPNADEWMAAWNYLSEAEKAIFTRMYGSIGAGIDGVMRVKVAGGGVFVRIIREPNGTSGIYYWNATTGIWTRFENGYNVQGIGQNNLYGVTYSKNWLQVLGRSETIEQRPGSGDVFSPAIPHNFNKTPDITSGPGGSVQGGGAGGGGLDNQTGNPG
jgi:hypothetical protein